MWKNGMLALKKTTKMENMKLAKLAVEELGLIYKNKNDPHN